MNSKTGGKRKIPVVGTRNTGQDDQVHGKKHVTFAGSQSSDAEQEIEGGTNDQNNLGFSGSFAAMQQQTLDQIGDFAEEHLYGVKVPLLHKFPGYGKKIKHVAETSGGTANTKSSPILDFAIYGKTAAVLYKVQKSVFRCMVFSCETEMGKEQVAGEFSSSAGKRSQTAQRPRTPNRQTGTAASPLSPTSNSKKKEETNSGGLFGSMFSAITAPVTMVASATESIAASTGLSPVSGRRDSSRPTTADANRKKLRTGYGQAFHKQPTFSDDGFLSNLPPIGSKAHRMLIDEEISECSSDEEDLAYFTAAGAVLPDGTVGDEDEDSSSDDEMNREDLDGDDAGDNAGDRKTRSSSSSAAKGNSPFDEQKTPTNRSNATTPTNAGAAAGGASINPLSDSLPTAGQDQPQPAQALPIRPIALRTKRDRKRQQQQQPITTLPKIKFQLPSKKRENLFQYHNVGLNVDAEPKIAVYRHFVWIVDEISIYCYSVKTGQLLIEHEHKILDPELEKAAQEESNPDDDNGLLPNIVSVNIVNVFAKTRVVLVVATNHVVKCYWVPAG